MSFFDNYTCILLSFQLTDSHKPRGIEISLGGDEGDSDSDDMVIGDENKGVSWDIVNCKIKILL